MQAIANDNKLFNGSLSDLILSIAIMILSFIVFICISVFINANKVYEVLSIVLIYSSGILYLYKKHPIDFAKELHKPLLAKYTIIGLLIGMAILAVSFTKYYLWSEHSQVSPVIFSKNEYQTFEIVIYMLSACMIIPICEEILFRYYFYNILKNKYSLFCAVIVSTLLFASVHYYNPDVLAILIQGLLYTYVFEKSKSIWSSIILHSVNNSIWHFIAYNAQ